VAVTTTVVPRWERRLRTLRRRSAQGYIPFFHIRSGLGPEISCLRAPGPDSDALRARGEVVVGLDQDTVKINYLP
jgi:hypothetical protein